MLGTEFVDEKLPVAESDIEEVVFFFQAEDGIRDYKVTGVQTCALPILIRVGVQRLATAELLDLCLDEAVVCRWIFGWVEGNCRPKAPVDIGRRRGEGVRSGEHTSELQAPCNLVCRLLLEKKKTRQHTAT